MLELELNCIIVVDIFYEEKKEGIIKIICFFSKVKKLIFDLLIWVCFNFFFLCFQLKQKFFFEIDFKIVDLIDVDVIGILKMMMEVGKILLCKYNKIDFNVIVDYLNVIDSLGMKRKFIIL